MMSLYKFGLCGVFCGAMLSAGACFGQDIFSGYRSGELLVMKNDALIRDGARIVYNRIEVRDSITVENNGAVYGDWFVCDGCNIVLQNSGDVFGTIHLGENAHLTQLVRGIADLTVLDVDASYRIAVTSDEMMDWGALYNAAARAGQMLLYDVHIFMSDLVAYDATMPEIELAGRITITLDDALAHNGALLMQNVSGGADVVIDGDTGSRLFAFSSHIDDGDLYLSLVRETDYYKILGTRTGIALNALRQVLPDDALLRKLDAAQTMGELHRIMSHSIAINPIRLRRPVQVIDSMLVAWNGAGRPQDDGGVIHTVARPFGLVAGNMSAEGVLAGLVLGRPTGPSVGLFGYGANADSDDDINRFSATLYGGGVNAGYVGRVINARAIAGASRGAFDVPYVFDGWRIRNRVDVTTMYAVADVGMKMPIMTDFAFVPYVGAQYMGGAAMGVNEGAYAMRAGVDTALGGFGETVRYDVRASGGVNTNSDFYTGIGVGFRSVDDMAGGDLSVNVIDSDGITAYVVSIAARVAF